MGTIKKLASALRSVNLVAELPKMMLAEKEFAIMENQEQLQDGRTSQGIDGANLEAYSNLKYAIKKNQLNSRPEFGIADLRLTGAFYSAFDLKVDATTYTLFSDDGKSLELESKYGKFIFGLQTKSKGRWAKQIYKNQIQPYITQKTGLIFR